MIRESADASLTTTVTARQTGGHRQVSSFLYHGAFRETIHLGLFCNRLRVFLSAKAPRTGPAPVVR
jgi:hypothetical protein